MAAGPFPVCFFLRPDPHSAVYRKKKAGQTTLTTELRHRIIINKG